MTRRKVNPKRGTFVPQDNFNLGDRPAEPIPEPAAPPKPLRRDAAIFRDYQRRVIAAGTVPYQAEHARRVLSAELEKKYGWLVAVETITKLQNRRE